MKNNQQIQIEEAYKFLERLTGEKDPFCCFQTFSDSGVDKSLTRLFPSSRLSELSTQLFSLNKKGAGIFVTINQTDGLGRTEKNIKKVRAYFADFDNTMPPDDFLKPDMVIQSKRGVHWYYIPVDNDLDALKRFTKTQEALINRYKSDKVVKDLPRVMRLPGFLHMKNPDEPYLVKIIDSNYFNYTHGSLNNYFSSSTDELKKTEVRIDKNNNHNEIERIFNNLPTEHGEQNHYGGRNNALMIFCRNALSMGLSDEQLFSYVEQFAVKSGLPLEECLSVFNAQLKYNNLTPFLKAATNEHDWANQFISECCLIADVKKVYLKDEEYYIWENGVYNCVSKKDFNYKIIKFLQEKHGVKKSLKVSFFNSVIKNVEAKLSTTDKRIENHIISNSDFNDRFISVNNGILIIMKDTRVESIKLVSHSPDYFTLSKLNFNYDPDAECPIFCRVIAELLPDIDSRNLIVEWMGYNLVGFSNFGKALILIGDGANGKSVITSVLIALLGKENTTSVGLEAFNQTRTFPLAATIGKLANIIEDSNEINKLAEGMLKSYITGGQFTVERKNRDPQTVTATAKITIATNTMPRFTDSTDGLYRRLLVVPFKTQILNPAKQDKRLNNTAFWEQSGEMPGVLNMAIRGLCNLTKRGYFLESNESKIYLEDVRMDNNPAQEFLSSYCRKTESNKPLFSPDLYEHYKQFCLQFGYRPCGENKFGKHIRFVYPKAVRSTSRIMNPKNKKRQHYYIGFELCEDVIEFKSNPYEGQF